MGSIEELKELTGTKEVSDLHRERSVFTSKGNVMVEKQTHVFEFYVIFKN